MAAQCFPLVGGKVMRVTRLDGCGRPDETDPDCVQVTSDGFVSIEVTANINEGDAITVTNAAGKTCINQTPCPELTGYSANITFCNVDPDLFSLTTGQASVVDPDSGEGIGFRVNTGRSGCDSGFALEIWSSVPGVTCADDADPDAVSSGYILFPFLQGGVFGDFTIENDAVSFVVQGAVTKDGSGWGTGPYDVVNGAGGAAGPLTTPIDAKDHLHVQLTQVPPPEPTCGCGPLEPVEPPVPATGATAGTPGTWTPAGSAPPANAAAAGSITASPNTAWTTGQYVQGSTSGTPGEMFWDGDSWTAGKAA